MKCAACHERDIGAIRNLCALCIVKLPTLTIAAYRDNRITTRQAVDCLRTRTASVKTFGGGRK